MSALEALSYAIDWPAVGWAGVGIVLTLAVAILVVEVGGEVRRKRRIRRIASRHRAGE